MEAVQELEGRLKCHEEMICAKRPLDPAAFDGLAPQLGRVWEAPETDVRLKKRLLRTLLREVVADVDEIGGRILLVLHWQGGVHTELTLRRRKIGRNGLHTAVETVEVARQLARVLSDDFIAAALNTAGLRTGHGNRWTRERVVSLRRKHGIARHTAERQQAEGWMTLTQSAKHVGVSPTTLRIAAERGQVAALHPLPRGPWIFSSEDLGGETVRTLVERVSRRRSGAPDSRQQNLDF